MAQDGPTDELLRRLLSIMSERASAGSLIEQAKAEAEEEVRKLLKSAFKATLLRQAVEHLERDAAAGPEPTATQSAGAAATSSMPDSLAEVGCYLYAITPAIPAPAPDEPAIDPAFPVELLQCDDLQAIVSQVSLEEFGQAALNDHVADPQWVEAMVRTHDRIIKNASSFGAVIPCRFCTIVRSRDDVRMLLTRHHDRVASTLASVAGKSEWGVELSRSVPASSGNLPENMSGKAYLLQKQRAEDQRRQLQQDARDRAMRLHEELAAAASDATQLPIRHRPPEDRGELLLNGAYLVSEADTARFHALVNACSDRYAADGWHVEITGPWPPYNFANLDLSTEIAA